jgi:flagellar assembly factor FliW
MLNVADSKKTKVIRNKFGEMEVNLEKAICINNGLVGFSEYSGFAIIGSPNTKFANFLILQSLEDDGLAFLVFPLLEWNTIYKEEDIATALSEVGFNSESTTIFLIVSSKKVEDGQSIVTVNARAPILIDSTRKIGCQYVIHSNDYDFQQKL